MYVCRSYALYLPAFIYIQQCWANYNICILENYGRLQQSFLCSPHILQLIMSETCNAYYNIISISCFSKIVNNSEGNLQKQMFTLSPISIGFEEHYSLSSNIWFKNMVTVCFPLQMACVFVLFWVKLLKTRCHSESKESTQTTEVLHLFFKESRT